MLDRSDVVSCRGRAIFNESRLLVLRDQRELVVGDNILETKTARTFLFDPNRKKKKNRNRKKTRNPKSKSVPSRDDGLHTDGAAPCRRKAVTSYRSYGHRLTLAVTTTTRRFATSPYRRKTCGERGWRRDEYKSNLHKTNATVELKRSSRTDVVRWSCTPRLRHGLDRFALSNFKRI